MERLENLERITHDGDLTDIYESLSMEQQA